LVCNEIRKFGSGSGMPGISTGTKPPATRHFKPDHGDGILVSPPFRTQRPWQGDRLKLPQVPARPWKYESGLELHVPSQHALDPGARQSARTQKTKPCLVFGDNGISGYAARKGETQPSKRTPISKLQKPRRRCRVACFLIGHGPHVFCDD